MTRQRWKQHKISIYAGSAALSPRYAAPSTSRLFLFQRETSLQLLSFAYYSFANTIAKKTHFCIIKALKNL